MRKHEGLSCSEWIDALKMTANVSPVRAIPGRSQDNTHCRRCSEIETLPHVLGFCPFGETLRNVRHHTIRSSIANALRENGFTVHEEVYGLAINGSSRRIDMLVIKPSEKKGYIFDPTVRFETTRSQPSEVNDEKRSIYIPTIDYYKNHYGLEDIEVFGLLFGARGTIPNFTANILHKFGIQNNILQSLAVKTIKGSLAILKNHLYNNNIH